MPNEKRKVWFVGRRTRIEDEVLLSRRLKRLQLMGAILFCLATLAIVGYGIYSSETDGTKLIIRALEDKDMYVRMYATFALGGIKDARAVDPLIKTLKDKSPYVRSQAAFSLGQIRSKAAVDALALSLKDPIADTRKWSAWALGEINDPQAIEPLYLAAQDEEVSVATQAIFSLGKITDGKVLSLLEEISNSQQKEAVKTAAETTLRNLKPRFRS